MSAEMHIFFVEELGGGGRWGGLGGGRYETLSIPVKIPDLIFLYKRLPR
jgi:hypothetical protein